MRRRRAFGLALLLFWATEALNTGWKVYWDESTKFVAYAEIDSQCVANSRIVGHYCVDARENLKNGFVHTVLVRTVSTGKYCLGHRCDELWRDLSSNLMTAAKWGTILATTGGLFAGPATDLGVRIVREWWGKKTQRKFKVLHESS